MRPLLLFLFLFFNCTQEVKAQWVDTLKTALRGRKSFDFRFESRNSFVDNERTEIQSLKFGITFGRKLSAGLGYSWLSTPVIQKIYVHDPELSKDTLINKSMKLNYVCTYVDFIFYKTKRWQYSVPMQFGIGGISFYHSYREIGYESQKRTILLYEPGVNVKYKIFSWLGIGANVGYRIVLKNNKYTGNKLNSPIYSAGVLIYWDKILVKLLPNNKKINEWFGSEEW